MGERHSLIQEQHLYILIVIYIQHLLIKSVIFVHRIIKIVLNKKSLKNAIFGIRRNIQQKINFLKHFHLLHLILKELNCAGILKIILYQL